MAELDELNPDNDQADAMAADLEARFDNLSEQISPVLYLIQDGQITEQANNDYHTVQRLLVAVTRKYQIAKRHLTPALRAELAEQYQEILSENDNLKQKFAEVTKAQEESKKAEKEQADKIKHQIVLDGALATIISLNDTAQNIFARHPAFSRDEFLDPESVSEHNKTKIPELRSARTILQTTKHDINSVFVRINESRLGGFNVTQKTQIGVIMKKNR